MNVSKKILLLAVLMLLFTECHDNSLDKKSKTKLREFTNLIKDSKLQEVYAGIIKQVPNGKIKEDFFENANWNRVYKVDDEENNKTLYSIPVYVTKPLEYTNIILAEIDDEPQALIVTYKPNLNWLKTRPKNSGLKNFTGNLSFQSIQGQLIYSSEYVNGNRVSTDSNEESGRVKYCETYFDITWTVVSVNSGDLSLEYVTEMTITEYEICYEDGVGGGSYGGIIGGGSGDGGGGSGGGSNGGSSSGGDASVSPDPDPEIPIIDPEDISYYLRPVINGDDVNNPYNGMKATDANGVVYTYNAEINAWMLPDITILLNNGYQFQNGQTPNYGGNIISTVAIIAIAEPTPVGEIILAGFIIGVFVYELYEVSTAEYPNEACLDFYEECQIWNTNYGSSLDCSGCLTLCYQTQIGKWPFTICPIGYY